ncbi:E3 ubiquitin-protein ligase listerin isoform X2 [Telopea speciosissima]|uniref:E3 ubiquitin-protein ligase listerin isoform X2 n=1 Tax=Telopea speciosissima TaxID=54955 RepID=UPI001CC6FF20|nr:E3 ubiquitin-protein ligase listerin isoform X2 [Telopea speciosissima]
MGRPKGEGARSKNRPSSSSLAASLLPTGATSVGFGGYVGSSRLDSTHISEDANPFPDVDGEVALHLKRLGRKDPTTKLKALTSLCELFKQKSGEEVAQIIPQWAFEYKRLLQDYNREVRRATNETMTSLVITVGRGLAPHLKSLMGPWWFSQFDPVPEVSQSARQSLQAAFPAQDKRLDALILCTNEIFLYLEENLKLTPQTMSDKAAPLDELEETHQQVVSSSLLALATLIDILFGTQLRRPGFDNITAEPKNASKARETAISSAGKIFSTHKYFVDFLKSQSPGIRSATYSILGSFIRHVPHAFNQETIKTLSVTILGAFQEKDPACHSPMWETVLLFSKKFSDSWTNANIQKTVLNRFWIFLRNGCYGSQQVSYPNLIHFLDTIPPKAIIGEQFLLNFFQNLWAGRNQSYPSSLDRLAFFKAFQECFLWSVHNASRYCNGVDAISQFRVSLMENILLLLLWHDYLLLVNPKSQGSVFSDNGKFNGGSSEDSIQSSGERTKERRYPMSDMQELGKCIIGILSDLSTKEGNLLSTFCAKFQEDCLEMLRQEEHLQKSSEHIEQVVNFFSLLGNEAVQKGEKWPLDYLAGPLMAKSFPLIRSMDSPEAVRLLSIMASIFGPQEVGSQLFVSETRDSSIHLSGDGDHESRTKHFLQVFKEDVVPWCLRRNNRSMSACLDLLLALLDNECFVEQWSSILTYATKLENPSPVPGPVDFDHVAVLAMLMEKIRKEISKRKRKVEPESNIWQGSDLERWKHKLLDSAAVSVACCSPPFTTSYACFLRSVLGGSVEDDKTSFLSRDATVRIFEEVLKKIIIFLMNSSFPWAKHASSLILLTGEKDTLPKCESYDNALEMAQFALEVLEGSFFCLKTFDEKCELVSCISAAIFIIDWECRMAAQVTLDEGSMISEYVGDGESRKKFHVNIDFGESIHAFRCKISTDFWNSLSMHNLNRLGSILIQTIRSTIMETDTSYMEKITPLCCQWMLEVLEYLCWDCTQEQNMLDQLLDEGSYWQSWVLATLSNVSRSATSKLKNAVDTHTSRHHQFVAFVDKLISALGVSKVIAGSVLQTASSSAAEAAGELVQSHSYSRAWLAAEMLCTWKWQGGNALGSFLPLLSDYAKSEKSVPGESLLDSIVNILLGGALLNGYSDELSFSNIWPASDDEIESIQEPFLRALVSLLSTLFIKANVWGKEKAVSLYESLVDKLFIGMTVNRICLRILPFVMNTIIKHLRSRSIESDGSCEDAQLYSLKKNQIQGTMKDWLQRALLLPPLITWKEGQDVEEWVQLIISCYPLSEIGGVGTIKMALRRDLSHSEEKMLLELFRKQRCDGDASNTANQLSAVQVILSKLIVVSVAYCWKNFDVDDWDFVLSQVRGWIESAVLLMEEIAENIDNLVTNTTASDNSEVTAKKLEKAIWISDPYIMTIARNALFAFSLFCGLIELQQEENAELITSLQNEKWDIIKNRILEDVLRLFFATGIAEAIASSCCPEGASIIASTRLAHLHFWELVASNVISSSNHVRNVAVKSIELWGLSNGPISSLYAILFSSKPTSSLQLAAFLILTTEPLSHLAITKEDTASCLGCDSTDNLDINQSRFDSSAEETVHFREEISCMIEKSSYEILEMELVAQHRVNVFIAWALVVSHLHSLPSSSPAKERIVQCILDSADSIILHCIFQHIPWKFGMGQNWKKDVQLPAGVSEAATAAGRAITTGSLLFAVESLWPIGTEQMASLAGALYGLMLRVLPAYVRDFFAGLRDRSTSSTIESFTKLWCSPPLLEDEMSQIKMANVADENFSISVNKTAFEVVATYKKEESGMDLVIRLPISYPLRPVDVDCTSSLGISESKKRKWLMSLTAFVRYQNGALAEAIRIWKSNFDKEFLGVEECPICYSIIHTSNHSLPRLACKTCKHKFHGGCLYKWFSTSHKSTCPLCQSPF